MVFPRSSGPALGADVSDVHRRGKCNRKEAENAAIVNFLSPTSTSTVAKGRSNQISFEGRHNKILCNLK